jgi:hypothetical protein
LLATMRRVKDMLGNGGRKLERLPTQQLLPKAVASLAAEADATADALRDGVVMIKQAVMFEKAGNGREARDLYFQAAETLSVWLAARPPTDQHRDVVAKKVTEYRERSSRLTDYYGLPPVRLFFGAAEFRVKYFGCIPDIPCWQSSQIASEVFDEVDEAKYSGALTWSPEEECVLTISGYGIKFTELSALENNDPPFVRVPLHKIASVNYVADLDEYMLVIKAGDTENNFFEGFVLTVATEAVAIEVCQLIKATLDEAYHKCEPEVKARLKVKSLQPSKRSTVAGALPVLKTMVPDSELEVCVRARKAM